jgi:hypothetical protein
MLKGVFGIWTIYAQLSSFEFNLEKTKTPSLQLVEMKVSIMFDLLIYFHIWGKIR